MEGAFWAIQCTCYDEIDNHAVDSFLVTPVSVLLRICTRRLFCLAALDFRHQQQLESEAENAPVDADMDNARPPHVAVLEIQQG